MLEELRSKFRGRFIETARARIARTRGPDADSGVLVSELHALAGEASLLEFAECARLAREAEQHARAGEGRKCREVVNALAAAIETLAS
jgi:HPt (histidine-containing phosphotransfer) domain-containing protein